MSATFRGKALVAVARWLRASFRDVAWVGPDELALALASARPPLLLDSRSEAEFAVSHLRGARRIDPRAPDPAVLAGLPEDSPVVVYCSLGYRSARVVRRLRDAGFRRASNLEGGAFQWAAEGRGLVDASAPTALVHPYGAFWGFLLLDARHRGRAA